MYVLVAAVAAIIWGSSSAGALPLLRHDDDHHYLHITPKASKQASKRVGPIILLLVPHFCSISAHCAGADVEFSFKDSSVENLQPNTKPISLLNSLELLYLQHSPS
jgi:hypothetical protein